MRCRADGESVYVHCTYWPGRPTLAMAYLIQMGYLANEAFEFVKWRHWNTRTSGSPLDK